MESIEIQDLQGTSNILKNMELNEYYRSIFNCCDTNKDGCISISELKRFIEVQEGIDIPELSIDIIYSKFDKNKDAQLDFEEFLEMMINPIFKNAFEKFATRYLKFIVVPSPRSLMLKRTVTLTGTYEKQIKCNTFTWFTLMVSLLQMNLFYINKILEPSKKYGPIHLALRFDPARKYEIYRYLSPSLVHSDSVHLYGNIVIQLLLGIPLEMVHTWRVLVIYVTGIIGGCLTSAVFDPEESLVGASAGVYSLCTAHIATVMMNWREMSHPAVHFLIFLIVTSFDPVYQYIKYGNNGKTSYLAHLGGAVVGLLMGVEILKNLIVRKKERLVRFISILTLCVLAFSFITADMVMTLRRASKNR